LLILALVPRLPGRLEGVLGAESFVNGQTIWGYDRWKISMPVEPDVTVDRRGIAGAVRYAAAHPVTISALLVARVAVHFGDIRPFYSSMHNVLIVGWLAPVYLFAVRGWRVAGSHSLAGWSVAVIGAQTVMVALTHADRDGRYLAHVLPLIYVFSACGVAHWLQTRGARRASRSRRAIDRDPIPRDR
jgi:hypothetical protein